MPRAAYSVHHEALYYFPQIQGATILKRPALGWGLSLLGGFGFAIALYGWYRVAHPTYSPEVVRMSRGFGIPIDRCKDLRELLVSVDNKPPGINRITDSECERLKEHLISSIPNEQAQALGIMGQLSATPHKPEVVVLSKAHLHDASTFVQTMAMVGLFHMGDSGWRELAEQSQSSTDQSLRTVSQWLLKQNPK